MSYMTSMTSYFSLHVAKLQPNVGSFNTNVRRVKVFRHIYPESFRTFDKRYEISVDLRIFCR